MLWLLPDKILKILCVWQYHISCILIQSVHNIRFIKCYLVPDHQGVDKYSLEFAMLVCRTAWQTSHCMQVVTYHVTSFQTRFSKYSGCCNLVFSNQIILGYTQDCASAIWHSPVVRDAMHSGKKWRSAVWFMQCILVKSGEFENSYPLLYIILFKSWLCCCLLHSNIIRNWERRNNVLKRGQFSLQGLNLAAYLTRSKVLRTVCLLWWGFYWEHGTLWNQTSVLTHAKLFGPPWHFFQVLGLRIRTNGLWSVSTWNHFLIRKSANLSQAQVVSWGLIFFYLCIGVWLE